MKRAIHVIFALCLTLPIPAIKLKFALNKILKIRNAHEYANSCHEYKNFCPKRIVAISGHNTINNPDMLIAKMDKYL